MVVVVSGSHDVKRLRTGDRHEIAQDRRYERTVWNSGRNNLRAKDGKLYIPRSVLINGLGSRTGDDQPRVDTRCAQLLGVIDPASDLITTPRILLDAWLI